MDSTSSAKGDLALARGEHSRARSLVVESLEIARTRAQTRNSVFVGRSILQSGLLAIAEGAPGPGIRLIAAAVAPGTSVPLQMYLRTHGAEVDASVTTARRALGEEEFARLWAEGQTMTLDQTVAFATTSLA